MQKIQLDGALCVSAENTGLGNTGVSKNRIDAAALAHARPTISLDVARRQIWMRGQMRPQAQFLAITRSLYRYGLTLTPHRAFRQ